MNHRRRLLQIAFLSLVVALGLASRRYSSALPLFISRFAGDTLWATAVFLGIGLIWREAETYKLAVATATISLAVEVSQLAHPTWLETVRSWPGAGLVLGYDFVPTDLVCYAFGVVLGIGLDRLWLGRACDVRTDAAQRAPPLSRSA